jgi:hypothetical protein
MQEEEYPRPDEKRGQQHKVKNPSIELERVTTAINSGSST